jgi:hypothetical protein
MWQIIKSYNILFLVVKMFEEHIFATIQEKIGFSLKNSHLMIRGELSSSAIRSLPQLSPHQIRMLCKAQEQTVTLTLSRFFKGSSWSDLWTSTKKLLLSARRGRTSRLSLMKR